MTHHNDTQLNVNKSIPLNYKCTLFCHKTSQFLFCIIQYKTENDAKNYKKSSKYRKVPCY